MKLNSLSLQDKGIFKEYLDLSRHELSVYSFESIYIWKGLFDIRWSIMENSLCVFFTDKIGSFLYLSPLSRQLKGPVIAQAFKILDGLNRNKEVSRIENVEEPCLEVYTREGYACVQKSVDFVCLGRDLAQLRGNAFKSKRASLNQFVKNHAFSYLPYRDEERNACLRLFELWVEQRRSASEDSLYRGMLQDTREALKVLLDDYVHFDCMGRIVRVDGEVKAFTFGFSLNPETFCILYEVTDLTVRGLAQFIFREFCRELSSYRYINIMDDSGLENLKRVKLSYRPARLIPSYIVKRKN